MDLAIVHYHLAPGGVTRVLVNHLRALAAVGATALAQRVGVFHSGSPAGWPERLLDGQEGPEISLHEVPGLEYDRRPESRPRELADDLLGAFREAGLEPETTIIHAHNHALGKNVSLPGALTRLARQGYRLLLQVHDFAEDFRPQVYRHLVSALAPGSPGCLPGVLYPQAPHIHYAVLNRRDREILGGAGVHPSRLHLLPNPVTPFELSEGPRVRARLAESCGIPAQGRLVLYPVRGIRRKNLGEALLWSALGVGERFAFTLPPQNPVELPAYSRWKEVAAALGLPCFFELGVKSGLRFSEHLAAADFILTTSVAEGFGMVFLESWLARRPLIGRDLPEITADFDAAGVRLDHLRPTLAIPIDWPGREAFGEAIRRAYGAALASYQRPMPPEEQIGRDVDGLIRDGSVDFGILDATLQRRILEAVRRDPAHRARLHRLNPWMDGALSPGREARSLLVDRNSEIISREYSLPVCGRRLDAIYRSMAASSPADFIEPPEAGERILDSFLDLARFHPIRVGP